MKLTQPEIIQILRRRMDMNQGTLGARAFDTSFESGRTKIKNIELGRQQPTASDLEKMAVVLQVPASALTPAGTPPETAGATAADRHREICLTPNTLAIFPNLAPYFEMLNKAATINDEELINHLSEKIAQLFQLRNKPSAVAPRKLVSGKR